MNKYEVIKTIGEGAYGVVLQCRNKETGELVAIKRFKESDEDDLVRKTTLREVKILRLLKEETFVVHLLEAFRRKGKLYLVFEYVGCNLLDVLEQHPQGLDMEEVRRMIFTLLLGVRACHSNSVIHRDIKPENLLLHPDKTLRLCDFGFARIYNNSMNDLTDYVATRWYRSPELLLGTTDYGLPSDMWAIGCIMGEMIDGQALFPGESELDQIFMIQKLLGNFTPQQQEVFRKNKRFANETLREIGKTETTLERKYGRKANKKAVHFLKSILVIDPEKRLTVDEAINHPFFEGMMELYAPQLKLITPLIRPSTATRAYSTMQQQQQQSQSAVAKEHASAAGQAHSTSNTAMGSAGGSLTQYSSNLMGQGRMPLDATDAMPPRPASTSLPTDSCNAMMSGAFAYGPSSGNVVSAGGGGGSAAVHAFQSQQQPQQLSSRVSQASSGQSGPPQQPPPPQPQQQQPSRSNSFLPSRIGSGHRRPPSQQRLRDESGAVTNSPATADYMASPYGGSAFQSQLAPQQQQQPPPQQPQQSQPSTNRSAAGYYGSVPSQSTAAFYGGGLQTTQAFASHATVASTSGLMGTNANLVQQQQTSSYGLHGIIRGNLPRLGQVPGGGGGGGGSMMSGGAPVGPSGFARLGGTNSGGGFVNGGFNPVRMGGGGGGSSNSMETPSSQYRPPPSQQGSRSRFFYQ